MAVLCVYGIPMYRTSHLASLRVGTSRAVECYLEYMLAVELGDDVPTQKDPDIYIYIRL